MKSLLTVEQLSQYLHKSVASIRSDATRNPQSLPPICRLPSTKRLLWRLEDVESWLAAHVEGAARPVPLVSSVDPRPRRGRPTKAEQVARQRSQFRKQAGVCTTAAEAEAAAEV
ncbi:DNA-binding protein [Burkholderia pseudomallei]|uniref:DNA-binding protein n=1 Tax=Burkholderia pseudomallei TaxID=28450 RepID=UPI00218095BA|nr:DNA-binding protein [Burkholderia pseudomallei]